MNVTPNYLEAAAALAKEKPSFAASVHEAHLDSLGLSTNATKEVVKLGPHVASLLTSDSRLLNTILPLSSAEQVEAVRKIDEGSNDRPTSNADTDKYIESRTSRGPGTGRYVSTQEGR